MKKPYSYGVKSDAAVITGAMNSKPPSRLGSIPGEQGRWHLMRRGACFEIVSRNRFPESVAR
jgi:hypothetical protein